MIGQLGYWRATATLQKTLWRAMHDEDGSVQRTAAGAYAKAFASSTEACECLIDALRRTRDLSAAAAMLEGLALGWSSLPETALLFEEAYRSHTGDLRLVGILGRAELGVAGDAARDVVLRCQNHWSDLSYHYRGLAAAMLMKYWPGDDMLVKSALERAYGDVRSVWEHDSAVAYLLESPAERADVRAWILAEFKQEFPFSGSRDHRAWAQVGRFAKVDREIRATANAYWCEPKNRLINLHMIPAYAAEVADEPILDALLKVLSEKTGWTLDRHWAMMTLLGSWGHGHPKIKVAIEALASADDDDLVDLVALLSEIMPNKAAARERLIRMGVREDVRRDLLAEGLE